MANLLCLSGEYAHNIDAKGRLFMPAKLRGQLGEGFFICKGAKNYLAVYSADDFRELAIKINSLSIVDGNRIRQKLFPSASECEVDSQGRILIPLSLRRYAELEKNVIIAGMGNHAAIWDKDNYEAFTNASEESLEDIMAELGF